MKRGRRERSTTAGRRRSREERQVASAIVSRTTAREGCSHETDAQAAQETRLRTRCAGDGQAALLQRQFSHAADALLERPHPHEARIGSPIFARPKLVHVTRLPLACAQLGRHSRAPPELELSTTWAMVYHLLTPR